MHTMIKTICLVAALLFNISLAQGAERIVLLPVAGELLASEKVQLADAAAHAVSGQYHVLYGDKVNQFVVKAFQDESKKLDCDESNCYKKIASEFKVDKIMALKIAKVASGKYLVALNLYDIPTGGVIVSKSAECSECSFEKLVATAQSIMNVLAKGSQDKSK